MAHGRKENALGLVGILGLFAGFALLFGRSRKHFGSLLDLLLKHNFLSLDILEATSEKCNGSAKHDSDSNDPEPPCVPEGRGDHEIEHEMFVTPATLIIQTPNCQSVVAWIQVCLSLIHISEPTR